MNQLSFERHTKTFKTEIVKILFTKAIETFVVPDTKRFKRHCGAYEKHCEDIYWHADSITAIQMINDIKTFYETDLATKKFFNSNGNDVNLCEVLGEFYQAKSEQMTLSKCIRFKASQLLYCHGDMEDFRNYSNKPKLERIESLVICHHNKHSFHSKLLKYFTHIQRLYIGHSLLEELLVKLPKLENLKIVNITRTQLHLITPDFFSDLHSIQLIDLRYNKFDYIERLLFHTHEHVKLFLFGNNWNCTKNLKWMVSHSHDNTSSHRLEIFDRYSLNCTDPKYRARPVLTVMSHKMTLFKACHEDPELKNCTCHISYLRFHEENNEFKPMFSVNCSSAGFVNFPRKLPDNTTTLFFTHNKVKSLNMLCTRNSTYNDVHDIYLDYNEITDVSVLDNCEWFLKFRILSLKGNKLETIPNYAFKNSFEKSHHAMKLYLSDNPWLCSCRLQPRLLKLCQKYELIVDQKRMFCLSKKNDDDIYGRPLMELTKTDVCKHKEFPLNNYEIMSN
ncbi:CLUMA_CG006521, isoform A [Clunio marinus]|uniref:CLUMA_CG006521, isoform A n=1 Tax=Clunio marinus TaxID=568069 RepID=A0A1J1I3L6_9DIPT|nr:CLUMA_CG006521, isoform A [Clunio marinus]